MAVVSLQHLKTHTMVYWTKIVLIVTVFGLSVLDTSRSLRQISRRPGGAIINYREEEKKILDSILGRDIYDNRIRPSGLNGTDAATIIIVNLYIRSFAKIDDVKMEYSVQITFRQSWNDERLAYDDRLNRGDMRHKIKYLTMTDATKVWMPDTFFRNEKEGRFHNILVPNVYIRIFPDGTVLYSIRVSLTLACPMDLKLYPLDRQECSLKVASYGWTTDDLRYLWKDMDPVQIVKDLHLPRFTLEKYISDYCNIKTNTGEYSCLKVDLTFKREFSYYLLTIYVPCCMLVIVSWVSFWLDPNAVPARVSLGVTTLLTMSTQTASISNSLPPVAYTKAIDVWTGVCVLFVFGALLEYALVNYASRSDAQRLAKRRRESAADIVAQTPGAPDGEGSSAFDLARQESQSRLFGAETSSGHQNCSSAANANERFAIDMGSGFAHQRRMKQPDTISSNSRTSRQQTQVAQSARPVMMHQHHSNPNLTDSPARQPGSSKLGDQRNVPSATSLPYPMGQPTPTNIPVTPTYTSGDRLHYLHAGAPDLGSTQLNRFVLGHPHHQPRPGQLLPVRQSLFAYIASKLFKTVPDNQAGYQDRQKTADTMQWAHGLYGQGQDVIPHEELFRQVDCCFCCSFYAPPTRQAQLDYNGPPVTYKQINFIQAWLNKFPSRAKKIDVISRITFPAIFAIFNLAYWCYYLMQEARTKIG